MSRVTVGLLASAALAAVVLTGWLAVYGIVNGDAIIGSVVNHVWVALISWVMFALLLAGVYEAARFGWMQHRLARASRRAIPLTDLRARSTGRSRGRENVVQLREIKETG